MEGGCLWGTKSHHSHIMVLKRIAGSCATTRNEVVCGKLGEAGGTLGGGGNFTFITSFQ